MKSITTNKIIDTFKIAISSKDSQPPTRQIKLNIGAGEKLLDGYINCDIRQLPGIDRVCDIRNLPFPPNYAIEIYAKDVLEHLPRADVKIALSEIHRVLKPGGKLFIQVPDLLLITQRFKDNFFEMEKRIFGEQNYPENTHKTAFTKLFLCEMLDKMGFTIDSTNESDITNISIWARKKS
jgi:predicted SAM-dependent methyltransferase